MNARSTPASTFVIVSRFGIRELEGGGFRSLFGRAMLSGTPLLTAVRFEYAGAWAAFHGGLGVDLPPNETQILAWAKAVVLKAPQAAGL